MKKLIYILIAAISTSCGTTQKGMFEITTNTEKFLVEEIQISEHGFKFKRNGKWQEIQNDSVEVREISP